MVKVLPFRDGWTVTVPGRIYKRQPPKNLNGIYFLVFCLIKSRWTLNSQNPQHGTHSLEINKIFYGYWGIDYLSLKLFRLQNHDWFDLGLRAVHLGYTAHESIIISWVDSIVITALHLRFKHLSAIVIEFTFATVYSPYRTVPSFKVFFIMNTLFVSTSLPPCFLLNFVEFVVPINSKTGFIFS